MKQEKLQEFLWLAAIWICVIFFAFAAGVWYDENVKPNDAPVEEQQAVIVEASKPVMAAADKPYACQEETMPIPATETPSAGLDPMIEDSYLRDDIPLSYELQAMLYGACLEFEIEYPLALAMLEQETQFKNIKGDGGNAYGYFQVWPYWHGDRMKVLGVTDLMEPEGNFRVAMHYIRELLDRFGNLEDALCFYNSGKTGGNKYSREVMEGMMKYEPDLR